MIWLQSVQNATGRLVSGARQYDHITPVLQELHYLRVPVDFKIAIHPGLSVTVRHGSS